MNENRNSFVRFNMEMIRNVFIIALLVLLTGTAGYAQKGKGNRYSIVDEENAIYKHEWSLGARFHTNGFSTQFERVWINSIYKKTVLQANFFYFKDFKETRQQSIYTINGIQRKFFYGKQNTFFTLNVSYGKRKILANKMEKNGVRVSMVYMGGVSLGVLKPYNLEFIDVGSDNEFTTFVEPYAEGVNDSIFLNNSASSRIVGGAGARYGFNGLQFRPGLHGKFGFNFDWANREYLVKAMELGVQVDVFYKNIDVLISDRNKPYILNFYLSLQMGKRW